MTVEEAYSLIKKELTKGSLQHRLGYDLHDKILNCQWDKLSEENKKNFAYFLQKEGTLTVFCPDANAEQNFDLSKK